MNASSTSTGGASTAQPDPTFDRWRKRFGVITGLGLSVGERNMEMQKMHRDKCETWRDWLMTTSPSVVFMLKHLKQTGCEVKPEHIPCGPCDFTRAGGFSPEHGAVLLCEGHYWSRKHMEDTLVHELVHMYDHCKFKVDWSNLRHHACSEIRANSLSGDCKWTRELRRGHVSFAKQHQACVHRRAILSVTANPACPDEATAERAVNEVWDSCFSDTRPFDEIY